MALGRFVRRRTSERENADALRFFSGLSGRLGVVLDEPAALAERIIVHAVEETEARTRNATRWLGGVDVHHTFFEGLSLDDGIYRVRWHRELGRHAAPAPVAP